ncbi:hypothetical protein [uncultured Fibrobacter sp.]|uniref:hypothetical protein n=1 Tax=uncultured Fibrobacter sp. TaxID=261512 RepID=UPI0025CD1975|nr:hypothetical protein [uncultured Fibrobacter sp.]
MLNLKQIFYIAFAFCVLAACSSDDSSVAGTTTIPNASAEITSSSDKSSSSSGDEVTNSSDDVESSSGKEVVGSSSSSGDDEVQEIVFSTEATSKKPLQRGEVSVYAAENGAEASCSVGQKVYTLRFIMNEDRSMQKMLYLDNFGSDCDSIFNLFKRSCVRGIWSVNPEAACSGNGRLKASCFVTNIDSLRKCTTLGCSRVNPDSVIDFDAVVSDFVQESDSLCSDIPIGSVAADSVDNRPELPLDSVVGVDTVAKRLFIIKPNIDTMEVSERENAILSMVVSKHEYEFLDSLAWSYRQKIVKDEVYGVVHMVLDYAQYEWTTPKEEYFVKGTSSLNRCNVDLYSEERGLVRYFDIFTTDMFDGEGNLESTILYMDSIIVYLAYGKIGSSAPMVKDIFRAECEATAGVYVDNFVFLSEIPKRVALTCAVKNFSGVSFESIVAQQRNLCKNEYLVFTEPD